MLSVEPSNLLVTTSLPSHSITRMQQTNSHFYLSGLSGTVAEIIGSWKAVVRFTRKEKEEKAVLLGGNLVLGLHDKDCFSKQVETSEGSGE